MLCRLSRRDHHLGLNVKLIYLRCISLFPGAAEKAAKDGEGFKQEAVTKAIKQRMHDRQRVKEKSFDMIR